MRVCGTFVVRLTALAALLYEFMQFPIVHTLLPPRSHEDVHAELTTAGTNEGSSAHKSPCSRSFRDPFDDEL